MSVNFFLMLNLFLVIEKTTAKLNAPRILLPLIKDNPVSFTLESTDGGCYRWHVEEKDVILIEDIEFDDNLKCSKKALVKTLPKYTTRKTSNIIAEDVVFNKTVRCDVIVDVIKTLTISTTTRELYIEDAPEAFEVRAYDDQGNSFTTLEGVEFKWRTICLGPNKEEKILKIIKFYDSSYTAPESITKLENNNKKGQMVLIEGVKTGSAKIFAKLNYKEYSNVKPAEVKLVVMANLFISPSTIFLMVGDEIKLKVWQLKRGIKELMTLPHKQYYLQAEMNDLAHATNEGVVMGSKIGKTKIELYDRNVNKIESNLTVPSAILNIVEPHKITITTEPNKNFAIMVNENIEIAVEAYTRNDEKIYLGDNVKVILSVDEIIQVDTLTKNGTWLKGKATKDGFCRIQAHLLGTDRSPVDIISTEELEIYPLIKISPQKVVLPWDPDLEPNFEIQLTASGGDGSFFWSSSNHSVGVVTQTGLVKTHGFGSFEVLVSMQRNQKSQQISRFFIFPPYRLEITEFVKEVQVGTSSYLNVALYVKIPPVLKEDLPLYLPLTQCQDLNFNVQVSNDNFVYNRSDSVNPVIGSCASLALIGLKSGSSVVNVTYSTGGEKLGDSVPLISFEPLNLIHPQGEIVLGIGCFAQLIFSGGPLTAKQQNSYYQRDISISDQNVLSAIDITKNVKTLSKCVIKIMCKSTGQTDITLSLANIPSEPKIKFRKISKTVTVFCENPQKVELRPALKLSEEQCPLNIFESRRMMAHSDKDIRIDVDVFDGKGRKFLDFSSLLFQWDIKPKELGKIKNPKGIFTKNRSEGDIVIIESVYQLVTPVKKRGEIEVSAQIVGYNEQALKNLKLTEVEQLLVKNEDLIKSKIQLILVDRMFINPKQFIVYNDPSNKKTISVKEGSGYFRLNPSENEIVLLKFDQEKKEIEFTPQKDGETKVEVVDLCLPSVSHSVFIRVVSVHIIRVEMPDKVEIGRSVPCTVRFYDEADNLLSIADLAMIDISVNLKKRIAKVKRITGEEREEMEEVHFIVTGLELGSATLSFSVRSGNKEIESAPIDLNVFHPLEMFPKNITLLVGSNIQYNFKGGPYSDFVIKYKTKDPKIIDVKEFGVINGLKCGKTLITAKAVGVNPTNGKKIVYSEDVVTAEVVPLTGLKIISPLTRFATGSTIPVWVTGLPDKISPVVLGSVDPPIRFEWILDDTEIAKIDGVLENIGIKYGQEDSVSIRLQALKAGKTILRLIAIVNGAIVNKSKQQNVIFKTSLNIEIFDNIKVNIPEDVRKNSILMTPLSSVMLRTNFDGLHDIKYMTLDLRHYLTDDKELSKSSNHPLITVSDSGMITSYENFGKALIFISHTNSENLTQNLTLNVEIKPVHYMMAFPEAKWKVKGPKLPQTLPLGSEFFLKTVYYDDTGSAFSFGNFDLNVESSRLDIVKLTSYDNQTIMVSSKKRGSSVIKLSCEKCPHSADYIKIHTEQAISPVMDKFMTIGDILCLQSPLQWSKSGLTEKWSVNQKSLEVLDASKGIIRILSTALSEILISHDLHQNSPTKLSVDGPKSIKLFGDSKKHVTNTLLNKPYVIPVVFGSKSNPERINNMFLGWDCRKEISSLLQDYPYKCHLQFAKEDSAIESAYKIFNVKPGFDSERGQYLCIIEPILQAKSKEISTMTDNLMVWVDIPTTQLKSAPVEIKFLPGVFVENKLLIKDQLYGYFSIYGVKEVLEQVKVEANDSSVLLVVSIDNLSENQLDVKIELLDYHPKFEELKDLLSLSIVSPLTSQNITVYCKVDQSIVPTCELAPTGMFNNLLRGSTGFIFVSTLVILIISLYVYINHSQPVVNVNVSRRSLLAEKGSKSPSYGTLLEESASFKRASIPLNIPSRYSNKLACAPGCSSSMCRRQHFLPDEIYGDSSLRLDPGMNRVRRFI